MKIHPFYYFFIFIISSCISLPLIIIKISYPNISITTQIFIMSCSAISYAFIIILMFAVINYLTYSIRRIFHCSTLRAALLTFAVFLVMILSLSLLDRESLLLILSLFMSFFILALTTIIFGIIPATITAITSYIILTKQLSTPNKYSMIYWLISTLFIAFVSSYCFGIMLVILLTDGFLITQMFSGIVGISCALFSCSILWIFSKLKQTFPKQFPL
ncbi:hypothetical protein [Ignatzschineria sp. LJL83]